MADDGLNLCSFSRCSDLALVPEVVNERANGHHSLGCPDEGRCRAWSVLMGNHRLRKEHDRNAADSERVVRLALGFGGHFQASFWIGQWPTVLPQRLYFGLGHGRRDRLRASTTTLAPELLPSTFKPPKPTSSSDCGGAGNAANECHLAKAQHCAECLQACLRTTRRGRVHRSNPRAATAQRRKVAANSGSRT